MDTHHNLEQRRAPRFQTAIATRLRTAEGLCGDGMIRNISSSGLQLECAPPIAMQLMPNRAQTQSRGPIDLHLEFEIPEPTPSHAKAIDPTPDPDLQTVTIKLSCQVIYVRRSSHTQYLLGCQFLLLEADSAEQLQTYLVHFAEPQQTPVAQPHIP